MFLTWIRKYNNIRSDFCFGLLWFVFSFSLAECYILVLRLFLRHFFRSVYIFTLFDEQRHLVGYFCGIICLSCWIFKFCLHSFSLSAGVSFLSGILWGNLFLRTGRNSSWEYSGLIILVVILCFCSIWGCWFLTIFLFVSAIPVGLSDRLAGLLNRTWWQGWDWTSQLMAIFPMVLLWAFFGNRLSTSAICSVTASITTVSRT